MLHALWGQGQDIADMAVLEDVAGSVGIDSATVRALTGDSLTRQRLVGATDEAIARSVFGAPTVAVGAELFRGVDRLWRLERQLHGNEHFEAGRGADPAGIGLACAADIVP